MPDNGPSVPPSAQSERTPYWIDDYGQVRGGQEIPPGHKRCAYCSQIVPREAHGMSCAKASAQRKRASSDH